MVRLAVIALLASLLTATARADVTVRAVVSPQRVQVGEPVTLTLDVNGAQDVPAPALNVEGFDARYVGPSTQISIVNGKMSASVKHRYSLLPLQPGRFTVGPFAIDYEGKHYQTAAFDIDVVGAAAAPPAAGGAAGQNPKAAARGEVAPTSLRLALAVPQSEVYLHERIPIDITLYIGAIRVGDLQYPSVPAEGLSLDKFSEPSQRQESINGQTFQVLHFQTTALPMRAGALTLGPAALHLNVFSRRRDALGDPFFERFFQDDPFAERHPFDVRADPITLNVLPLPEQGKPPTFSGAVGSFTMQVEAGPTQLTAGDPVTLRIHLTGSGNLSDATPPQLTSVDGFRIYEPHVTKSDDNSRSFEQVLIPNDASVHAIPPVRFSYFDPHTRQYQTLESQPVALVVRAPQNAPRSEVVGAAPASRPAAEEKLGRDIVYIKDDPGALAPRTRRWYGGALVLLWQPVPLLLFIVAVWYDRRRQLLSGDQRYARFTHAGRLARHGLVAAQRALAQGDRQAFYDALSRTMQDYLAAKLDLPPGGIDAAAVAQRGVSEDCVRRVRDCLATCEQVRFAPAASDGDMRGTLALAEDVVRQLERNRRLSPRSPGEGRGQTSPTRGLTFLGMLVIVAWVALAALVVRVNAAEMPASPQTTFFHANALYKDGQYGVAAQEYEQLLQSGVASGNLYFNLGNAYFKAGEKGKAMLNYERARRLMPSDPDLAANLAYAQSLTGVEPCVAPLWRRVAFPLAQRLASHQLVWLASIAYTLLMFALAAHRVWPRRPRWLLYIAATLALVTVVSGASLASEIVENRQQPGVIIAESETAARFEPAENGTVHFGLKQGAHVRLLDARDGWLQIARCDGRRGWIRASAVEAL